LRWKWGLSWEALRWAHSEHLALGFALALVRQMTSMIYEHLAFSPLSFLRDTASNDRVFNSGTRCNAPPEFVVIVRAAPL
jgi:hypothetical protein